MDQRRPRRFANVLPIIFQSWIDVGPTRCKKNDVVPTLG